MSEVTVVLSSCGRPDLLKHTLESFFEFNSYPVKRFIVVEDSGIPDINKAVEKLYPDIEWIEHKERLGQIKSLDVGYSLVTTPYIFHMEEDWMFYRSGFIENSMALLEKDPKIIQVWLRHMSDTNGHPTTLGDRSHRILIKNYKGKFHGFSFNPGLRRLRDYQLIGSFSQHTEFDRNHPGASEIRIGEVYRDLGFYAVILKEGYVRHIGDNRHVN